MDCEAVTDRLIDLLYEELDQADAEKARAHLSGCESCAAAFDRMSSGRELASMLKMEEPPSAVRVSVLAAARERAMDRASRPEPAREPARAPAREVEREEVGLWAAFVRWLGGFAMGPQVAMATMLLLMVGIGLWYLPELREHDPTDDNAILDSTDEVGPSATLEPAQPLELEADPRTGRMVQAEHDEEGRRPREHEDQVDQARLDPEPARVAANLPVAEDNEESAQEGERAPRPEPQVITEPIEGMELAEAEIPPGESMGQRPQPMVAPAPPPQQTQLAVQQAPPPPRVALDDEAPAGPADSSARARYERGMARYEQRDYNAAAEEFDAVVRRPDTDATRLLPSALHHLARSRRATGNCRGAIAPYEQLLGRHPSYPGAGDARVELGECYTRQGRLSDARRVLEQASRDPRVASRAQVELRRLETAEREHEQAADVEAAEPMEP
jgi:TolA-binding protein